MWVYTPTKPNVPAPGKIPESMNQRGLHFSDENGIEERADPHTGSTVLPSRYPKSNKEKISSSKRLHPGILPVFLLYLCGLCLGGALCALADGQTSAFIKYYANDWSAMFRQNINALHLFSTLFLSGIVSMSFVLLLGLCAFGKPFIYCLLLLKGIGSGLLIQELFLERGCKGILLYIAGPALSDCVLAGCLCLFCLSAAHSAEQLFQCLTQGMQVPSGCTKQMINQYLFLCTLQILSSGANAVLSIYLSQYLNTL